MKIFKAIFAAAIAAFTLQAFAQGYPNKPVQVVITLPPGTGTDIVGRMVTQKLSEIWGQSVLVNNRVGQGIFAPTFGPIGPAEVAMAVPDGYTLLIDSEAHVVTPAIYAKLSFDTLKDFVDISPLAGLPHVLVVTPGSSVKSLADFIAEAKAKPGQVNFAFVGIGSGTHLILEKFKLATGIDVVHVPYTGASSVVPDLMSGRVNYYFAPITPVIPLIRDGKLRALAVSSGRRSSQLPEVPTVAEAGVPGFEFTRWFGLWGPAGMPAVVVEKINKDVNRVLASPDVRQRLANLGSDAMDMSPEEFARFVRREIEDYARVIKAAGIKPQ